MHSSILARIPAASGKGLSQSLAFLPEDRRLGERDWIGVGCSQIHALTRIMHFNCVADALSWSYTSNKIILLQLATKSNFYTC